MAAFLFQMYACMVHNYNNFAIGSPLLTPTHPLYTESNQSMIGGAQKVP